MTAKCRGEVMVTVMMPEGNGGEELTEGREASLTVHGKIFLEAVKVSWNVVLWDHLSSQHEVIHETKCLVFYKCCFSKAFSAVR